MHIIERGGEFVHRHVQVNNSSAIEFYKQFDFEIVETKKHYYKRIEPADAYVLQKNLKKAQQSNGNHAHDGDTTDTGIAASTIDVADTNNLPTEQSPANSGKTKA